MFVLDAAADYPFVNQTTLIEYDLINLSCLTSDSNGKKAKYKMNCSLKAKVVE